MNVVIGTRRWLGADWTHVDADSTPLLDASGGRHPVDVVCGANRIPLPDRCAELVYSQECLEHFPWAQTALVVAEWARLVADGGRLRIEVPDFLAACKQVLDGDCIELDEAIQQIIFGGQINQWDYHYAGITPRLLTRATQTAGLTVTTVARGWEYGYLMVEARRN